LFGWSNKKFHSHYFWATFINFNFWGQFVNFKNFEGSNYTFFKILRGQFAIFGNLLGSNWKFWKIWGPTCKFWKII